MSDSFQTELFKLMTAEQQRYVMEELLQNTLTDDKILAQDLFTSMPVREQYKHFETNKFDELREVSNRKSNCVLA